MSGTHRESTTVLVVVWRLLSQAVADSRSDTCQQVGLSACRKGSKRRQASKYATMAQTSRTQDNFASNGAVCLALALVFLEFGAPILSSNFWSRSASVGVHVLLLPRHDVTARRSHCVTKSRIKRHVDTSF